LLGALAAVVLGSAACGYEPNGAAPLDVPPIYRQWWAEIEQCAHKQGAFDRVHFWVIKGDKFPCPNGPCAGHWSSPHDVYIAETWVYNASLVKHEMLHDVLGTGGHPVNVFGANACDVIWATQTDTKGS
jgi:hypothetical protein